jgi:hypothetical protein
MAKMDENSQVFGRVYFFFGIFLAVWERPPSRHALCRPSLDPLFGFPSTMFPSFDRFFSLSLVYIQPMDYMPGRDTHSHVSVSQANLGRA